MQGKEIMVAKEEKHPMMRSMCWRCQNYRQQEKYPEMRSMS